MEKDRCQKLHSNQSINVESSSISASHSHKLLHVTQHSPFFLRTVSREWRLFFKYTTIPTPVPWQIQHQNIEQSKRQMSPQWRVSKWSLIQNDRERKNVRNPWQRFVSEKLDGRAAKCLSDLEMHNKICFQPSSLYQLSYPCVWYTHSLPSPLSLRCSIRSPLSNEERHTTRSSRAVKIWLSREAQHPPHHSIQTTWATVCTQNIPLLKLRR